jgi:hypothetical protein
MAGHGGTAKVYFVLYLAIVVELLIIIVERDEAEEHLNRQNNETMKIVESILSQLYSGSGSEGINTKPQDEITLPAESDMAAIKEIFGNDLKTWRQYQIDVGVTDVSLSLKRKEGETVKEYDERLKNMHSLSNVEDLEYQIFFIPSTSMDTLPSFKSDEDIKKENLDFMAYQSGQSIEGPSGEQWTFVGAYKLSLNKNAVNLDANATQTVTSTLEYFNPKYNDNGPAHTGSDVTPRGMSQTDTAVFYYSPEKTKESAKVTNGAQKRSFIANFEPPDRGKAGIYKLRFASRTNRILGVSVLESGQRAASDEETKVNIGTVQLTVKDLKKVANELKRRHQELDKVPSIDELLSAKGAELVSKMNIFNTSIEEAKTKALSAKEASDLVGKIRLYEYVAKLVTPGQSVNFDQNRSNFDINVRVQTAKPSTANPYVSVLTENRCFTTAKHVFEIEAGPYKGVGANNISGSLSGPASASIRFEQIGNSPEQNGKYRLRGIVSTELPAGRYKMTITHTLPGKTSTIEDSLQVYETGLQDEKGASSYLANGLSYGRLLIRNFIPKSGNEITASQFKTIITFDAGNKKEIDGYNIKNDDNINLLAEYNNCEVDVVWIQPFTFQQFTLYKSSNEIRFSKPAIYDNNVNVDKISGSANKISVIVSGIEIGSPRSGIPGDKPPVKLSRPSVGATKITGIDGYSISGQPTIEPGDSANTYKMSFELVKAPNAKVGKSIQCVVEVGLSVDATHPTNGKQSSVSTTIGVPINFTPSSGSGGVKQPVGGKTPAAKTPAPKKPAPPKK